MTVFLLQLKCLISEKLCKWKSFSWCQLETVKPVQHLYTFALSPYLQCGFAFLCVFSIFFSELNGEKSPQAAVVSCLLSMLGWFPSCPPKKSTDVWLFPSALKYSLFLKKIVKMVLKRRDSLYKSGWKLSVSLRRRWTAWREHHVQLIVMLVNVALPRPRYGCLVPACPLLFSTIMVPVTSCISAAAFPPVVFRPLPVHPWTFDEVADTDAHFVRL